MGSEGPRFQIEALGPEHDRRGFFCGIPDLDTYLRERAGQDVRRHVAAVFVLVEDGPAVLGYYTLSQQVISLEDLPASIARKLPRYPFLPATLIGRLGVCSERQGAGLGSLLLMDALHRSRRAAQTVASCAVRVVATNDEALGFYLTHDFLALPNERLQLFFPMVDLDRRFGG